MNLLNYFNFYLSKTINRNKVRIPFINGIGLTNFILDKDWLDTIINAFIVNDDKIFIDAGINIGQTLIRVKTLRPDLGYIGFEPNPTCTSYVQQLIKINNFKNCIIQNCALSTCIQELILEKTYNEDPKASVIPSLRPGFFCHKDHVLALDYDSLYINQKITFIKIDVEGAELDVLKGMKQSIIKHQPIITCEVLDSHHPSVFNLTQDRVLQLCHYLYSINYSIIRLQTSSKEHKIISYEKLESITIKQWTAESYHSNDYLFYPSYNEPKVRSILDQLLF